MKETELKFRVSPDYTVPDLTGRGSRVATVTVNEAQRLEATYFDTADLRLIRLGVTLRHRSGEGNDGWDLKVPLGKRTDGVRNELHVSGELGDPPAELLAIVTPYLRGDAVNPVARLVTTRVTHTLLDDEGAVLAELVDDTVQVMDGDLVAAQFYEVEVEDKGGGEAVLAAVGKRLRASGAKQPRFEPKLARALGPLASAPADPPPAGTLPAKPTVGDLLTHYLRTHIRQLFDAEVALRLGHDEAVHDARVAARRLRSTLQTFGSAFVPETAAELIDELRRFGNSLGAARDAEVLLLRLRMSLQDLPAAEQLAARDYLDRWTAEQQSDLDLSPLNDEVHLTLLQRLASVAVAPPLTGKASAPASRGLQPALRDALRVFRSRMRRGTSTTGTPEDLHRARIAGSDCGTPSR